MNREEKCDAMGAVLLAIVFVFGALVAMLLSSCSGEAFSEAERGVCPDTVRECEPTKGPTDASTDQSETEESGAGTDSDPDSVVRGAPFDSASESGGSDSGPSDAGTACTPEFKACACALDEWCCSQWDTTCEAKAMTNGCGVCQ